MPSPFPGMDPYLEARWHIVHGLLATAVTSALNQVLPADLEARLEEQVRVAPVAEGPFRRHRPDVSVVGPAGSAVGGSAAATAVADPDGIPIAYSRVRRVERSVVVVDTADRDRLVTGIELLSPSNKRGGDDNRRYRRKLRRFERAGTNWVEVDLLRSPRTRLTVPWAAIPRDRRASYMAVTYRAADESLRARPISVRQPLPTIAVPTRRREPDVPLDLQAAFARAYADGSFKSVDYTRPPDPPLSTADAAWAAELVGRTDPSR